MFNHFFKSLLHQCIKCPWPVIIINIALILVAANFTSSNIKINTNTEEMLSKELTWRKYHAEYKSAFPNNIDNLVLIVESAKSSNVSVTTRELMSKLKKTEKFESITSIQESDFMRKNGLLYLNIDELNSLAPKLIRAQPFMGILSENKDFLGIIELLENLKKYPAQKDSGNVDVLLEQVTESIEKTLVNVLSPINWDSIFGNSDTILTHNRIIFLKPRLDFGKLLPAEESIIAISKVVSKMQEESVDSFKVTLTGGPALAYDELKSVSNGTRVSGMLAAFLVLVVLFFAFRSIALIFAICANLVAGLVFTATFATLSVGTLNMISIAFAVLYIGLAVDFAIHICMMYVERCSKENQFQAIENAITSLGKSLIFCTITTSIGFFSFIPTDYRGVAELGLISGVGMILSLILSFTFLPALLSVLPKPDDRKKNAKNLIVRKIVVLNKVLMVMLFVIAIFGLTSIQKLKFDNDPINLNNKSAPSIQGLNKLKALDMDYSSSISVLTPNIEEAIDFAEEQKKNNSIKKVELITSFVPSNQDEKIKLIEELNFIFGGEIESQETRPVNVEEYSEGIFNFLNTFKAETKTEEKLIQKIDRLINKINLLENNAQIEMFQLLNENIFYYFNDFTNTISDSLAAETISISTLPEDLRRLWISSDDQYRVEITPKNQIKSLNISSFKNLIGEENYRFSGAPIINAEAGDSVTLAFAQAITTAILIIFLISYILTKRLRHVFALLTPLFIANLGVIFFINTFSFPINFANIIALPLLLGIGIDSSIHVFYRMKKQRDPISFYSSSTTKAVIFSALTTALSFGSLAISSHEGTATLGILLMLGLGLITISVLSFIPEITKDKNRGN